MATKTNYATQDPSSSINGFQFIVEDVINTFVRYGLRLQATTNVAKTADTLLRTRPAGISTDLVLLFIIGITLVLVLWVMSVRWLLNGSYRYRLRVKALVELLDLRKRYIWTTVAIIIAYTLWILISLIMIFYFLIVILIWAHRDYPDGVQNMMNDVNVLRENTLSELEGATHKKFYKMKNQVHNLMTEYYMQKIPINTIQRNDNTTMLLEFAKFVTDASKNYDHKVYPYAKEGLLMAPRIHDVTESQMHLKGIKLYNTSWCIDNSKCLDVQNIISRMKNLEKIWPTEEMLNILSKGSNRFLKMNSLEEQINKIIDDFNDHMSPLSGIRLYSSYGIAGIREVLNMIRIEEKPQSLVNFGNYMQSWATAMSVIISLVCIVCQFIPISLYIISSWYIYKHPLGSWHSQKAIKLMSVGTTLFFLGTFILGPIMVMSIYGGAKVDMFACEILRQPKYEKSTYQLWNSFFISVMRETFVHDKLKNVEWDLAREMNLCRKGASLYKILHLRNVEDNSGGFRMRYANIAENTLDEYITSISDKIDTLTNFFDYEYENELSQFNETMRTLKKAIDLNNNFENNWRNEIQVPLSDAERILKKLRRSNQTPEIDRVLSHIHSILAFMLETGTIKKKANSLQNYLYMPRRGRNQSIFETIQYIKDVSFDLKNKLKPQESMNGDEKKEIINYIASEIKLYRNFTDAEYESKIGTCEPIYRIYHRFQDDACYRLGYSINGITTGLGVVFLSFIPLILVSHYFHRSPGGRDFIFDDVDGPSAHELQEDIKISTPHLQSGERDVHDEIFDKDTQFMNELRLVLQLQGFKPLPPSPTSAAKPISSPAS